MWTHFVVVDGVVAGGRSEFFLSAVLLGEAAFSLDCLSCGVPVEDGAAGVGGFGGGFAEGADAATFSGSRVSLYIS